MVTPRSTTRQRRDAATTTSTGFRQDEVIGETVRNLLSARVALALWMFLSGAAGVLVSAWSINDGEAVHTQWRLQQDAGASVLNVTAKDSPSDGTRLSAAACDRLNDLDGVVSAGAVISSDAVAHLPNAPRSVPLFRVTPGFVAVMYPHEQDAYSIRVGVGAETAQALGVTDGAGLRGTTTAGPLVESEASVLAPPARRSVFDDAVLVVVPAEGTVSECVVEARPDTRDSVAAAIPAAFGAVPVAVQAEFTADAATVDPQRNYRQRPSQWLPILCAIVICGASLVQARLERPQYAIYRAAGMTESQLLAQMVVSAAIRIFVPVTLAAAFTFLIIGRDASTMAAELFVRDYVVLCTLSAIAPLSAWLLIRGRSTSEVMKSD